MNKMLDEKVILEDDQESYLDGLTSDYFEALEKKKSYERVCKALGDSIKDFFSENEMAKYETKNGFNLSVSKTPNISVDEDSLVAFLKKTGRTQAIKTVEKVDFDEIETMIRTGVMQASELNEFKEIKEPTIRLNCSKSKKKDVILG